MRFFIYLFSIYILTLAVMPCSDAITCTSEKHPAGHADHDHSEDKSDMCSPFCICACCGGTVFVVYAPQFFMEKIKLDEPKFITPYYSDFNSSYFNSFWQPPKLSL